VFLAAMRITRVQHLSHPDPDAVLARALAEPLGKRPRPHRQSTRTKGIFSGLHRRLTIIQAGRSVDRALPPLLVPTEASGFVGQTNACALWTRRLVG
jgi:hypothetical protein